MAARSAVKKRQAWLLAAFACCACLATLAGVRLGSNKAQQFADVQKCQSKLERRVGLLALSL